LIGSRFRRIEPRAKMRENHEGISGLRESE
jgi:hypothetical protein